MGVKTEKDLFPKVSREKRGIVSGEASKSAAPHRDSMDATGQKYMMAYCSHRYTENRDKDVCIES